MIASRMTSPAAALALCGAGSRRSSRLPPTAASIQYANLRYDLLHEEDATGLVLSVFADVRARMPFVPAIFKALAREPAALCPPGSRPERCTTTRGPPPLRLASLSWRVRASPIAPLRLSRRRRPSRRISRASY